jgi:hypothetical protein
VSITTQQYKKTMPKGPNTFQAAGCPKWSTQSQATGTSEANFQQTAAEIKQHMQLNPGFVWPSIPSTTSLLHAKQGQQQQLLAA